MTPTEDHHCIFEVAGELFSTPAIQIREIVSKPKYAKVPCANTLIAGLWHEGSEFIPLIRLPFQDGFNPSNESQVLVVNNATTAWGLLVDRVLTIAPMECSTSTENEDAEIRQVLKGKSIWEGQPLRVVDVSVIYLMIEKTLELEPA